MTSEGLHGSKTATNLPPVFMAELIGTFTLVLVGTSVAVAAGLNSTIAGAAPDSLAVALAFGLTLAVLVGALGHISGCHLNPAVTIGLAVTGRFPWMYVPFYVIAQFSGSVLASLVVLGAHGDAAKSEVLLGATQPVGDTGLLKVILIEALVTFLLVLVIVSVATDSRVTAALAPQSVGFMLFGCIMIAGPITGGAVNPARAFGPMLVSGSFVYWYAYFVGPMLGGILGACVYNMLLRPAVDPSEAEDD